MCSFNRSLGHWIVLLVVLLTLVTPINHAYADPPTSVRVVNNAVASSGDGKTWPNAFKYLQEALDAARSNSAITQIWVASSTTPYRPDQGTGHTANARNETFDLVAGVTVYGGCVAGQDNLDSPTHRDISGTASILSGDLYSVGTLTDNSYHVVTANGIGASMTPFNTFLDGFTIRDGYGQITGTVTSDGGAGIYCKDNGNARFVNCVITNNFAGHKRVEAGGTETDENRTAGGGVQCKDSAPVFVACTISSNGRVPSWFIYGGGFATVGVASGGQIPKLISCTIQLNEGCKGGGVAVRSGSSLDMTNCLLAKNNAALATGFTGNAYGGGVSVDGGAGAVTITNCTFVLNSTLPSFAGGGYAQYSNSGGGTCKILNCIFWKNYKRASPEQLSQIYFESSSGNLEIRTSDIEGGSASITSASPTAYTNNIDADPQFVSSFTTTTAGVPANLQLQQCSNSPCRDYQNSGVNGNSYALAVADTYNIDNDGSTTEATPERRRRSRIVDTYVDLGCYERILCAGDCNGDGVVNIDDLVIVITSWGMTSGPGDINPAPCAGDNIVNIDDLVKVITSWGNCPDIPVLPIDSIPTTFQECWDKCSANFETGSEDWQTCMDACVEALCEMGYITEGCP